MEFIKKLTEKILNYLPDFNKKELEEGLKKFELMHVSAGDFLVQPGELIKGLYITENSITRGVKIMESGEEKTLWIEPEMKFVTDFVSYRFGTASQSGIQAYEDSDVFAITRENMQFLFNTYHDWARFGTSISEEYLIYIFYMTNLMVDNDAKSNYRMIEKDFPRFLRVVPLKHIASRFNISPVTISRIRGEKS